MRISNLVTIIGISLIVGGLLLAIYGYELYPHYVCNGMYCPSADQAVPISPFTAYTGIAVALGGIGFLVYFGRRYSQMTSDT